MPTVATKLFREPNEAEKAVSELKAKGFKAEEIAVFASTDRAKALGSDIKAVSDPSKMTEMGVPEDTVNYYSSSMPMGSIMVIVKADEGRVAQAQEVLRTVPVSCLEDRIIRTSPGFLQSSRMSATNPVDAPMSGDFRRY